MKARIGKQEKSEKEVSGPSCAQRDYVEKQRWSESLSR
jgi:hypothetical protein